MNNYIFKLTTIRTLMDQNSHKCSTVANKQGVRKEQIRKEKITTDIVVGDVCNQRD